MKYLAALPLAAVVAIGMASGAQALGNVPSEHRGPLVETYHYDKSAYHPHDRCHGLNSGTAHHACGTATGGPSGGIN